jgi:sec-independent protein translocase protein TatA
MTPRLAFQFPGGWEWLIVLIIALLIFGARLPSIMRSVGKSIVEFKKGIKDVKDDVDTAVDEQEDKKLEG